MDIKNETLVNPKILVAEDNEINRKLIVYALESRNIACDVAVNGKEALTLFLKKKYDIILMDCHMPVMSGYESTSKIRQAEEEKNHTIIIAMTANAAESEKEKCLGYGMDDYISKPIDFKIMFEMIEYYMKKCKNKSLFFLERYVNKLAEDTGFSKNDARELIYEFVDSLPKMLKSIKDVLETKNYEEVKKIAHQIKGTSANLRMEKLPHLAMKLQQFSEEKDEENCKQILMNMEKLFLL
ncbi:response regulator [Clostridium thailandense]|uniref:response regulator n=1 Tax=Clostridium thailandense TaxID=2794346 RepID=UPI003989BBB4